MTHSISPEKEVMSDFSRWFCVYPQHKIHSASKVNYVTISILSPTPMFFPSIFIIPVACSAPAELSEETHTGRVSFNDLEPRVRVVPMALTGCRGAVDARNAQRCPEPACALPAAQPGPAPGRSAPAPRRLRRGSARSPTLPAHPPPAPPQPAPLRPRFPFTADPELFSAPPAHPYLLLTNRYKTAEQSIALNDRV